MEKDNLYTQPSFKPKLVYPKKCVNCNKSEFATKQNKFILQKVLAKKDWHTSIWATIM